MVRDGGEIAGVDHFKQPEIFVHLELFVRLFGARSRRLRDSVLVQPVEGVAVEVHTLDGVEIFLLPLLVLVLNAGSKLPRGLLETGAVLLIARTLVLRLGDHNLESINETALRVVEGRQRDREVKDENELVCLIFDGLG